MRLSSNVALVGTGEARISDRVDCNTYAINGPEGTVLVDTGSGRNTGRILGNIPEEFGEVEAALLTHAHADHSQGGPDLQEKGIPVVAPTATRDLIAEGTEDELGLTRAIRDGAYPQEYSFTNYEPDEVIEPDGSLTVAGQPLDVVHVSGHAADHVCYLTDIDGRRVCFIGDVLRPDGSISLLNVRGSSLADYRNDIGKLADRDVDALLTGHGLPRLEDGQEGIDTAIEALRGMNTPPSAT